MKHHVLRRSLSALAAACLFCVSLSVADTPTAPKTDIWEDHLVHPFDAMVLTEQQIDRFLVRLAQSNPERAAELEKMRITHPQQFRWEIREELANRFFQRVVVPEAAEPKPATPAEPAVQPDPPSDAVRKRHEELLAWLEKAFPQQAAELKANPTLSEARMNELYNRYEPVMRAERTHPPLAEAMKEDIATQMQCDALLMELTYADPQEREKIIGHINDLTAKRFDLIVLKRQLQHDQLRRRLERLSQELDKQKEELDALRNGKGQAVTDRVKELIERTDKTNWN